MANCIKLTINGVDVVESEVPPNTTLLNYLRQNVHLTGTKEGCAEGDCGACTVVLVDEDAPGGPTFRSVNSCLMLLPMLHGRRIFTVDGLKDGDNYHPVQVAMAEALGSQCGYCTPGFIMSMFEACYRSDLEAGGNSMTKSAVIYAGVPGIGLFVTLFETWPGSVKQMFLG